MTTSAYPTRRAGQSIIEALVALGILSVGLLGVLTLLSRSFFVQRESADQAEASYLASEGLEVAKSFIDHGVYQGVAQGQESNGWSGALTNCFNFSGGSDFYYLDFETYVCPVPVGGGGASAPAPDPLFAAADGNGVYRYYASADAPRGAVKTQFSRLVQVSRPDTNTIDVSSTVIWSTGSFTGQSVTVEDVFYNWHP